MSNDKRIENISEEAVKELQKICLLLESDPELIESLSSDDLRNEIIEIGLDFHKPLMLFPSSEIVSLDSSLSSRPGQVVRAAPGTDLSLSLRDEARFEVDKGGLDTPRTHSISECSEHGDLTIDTTNQETRVADAAPPLVDSFAEFLGQIGFEERLRNLCNRYCYTKFGGAYEAEDLYQDCVQKVWENQNESQVFEEILSEGRFFGWLFAVVRNQYFSKVRQFNKHWKNAERGDRVYGADVIQIVDVYPSYYAGRTHTVQEDEAFNLSMLIKPLGHDVEKIAIVGHDDELSVTAYQREGYHIHPISRNRPSELRQFVLQMTERIKLAPPKHMVLVSEDPEFVHLCDEVASLTDLAVWANSGTVPRELTAPQYGWRPLEELMPDLRIPRIDVRIDLENIFIGLVHRGWRPNLRELIKSIRTAVEHLGEVVSITGYADFDELNRNHGGSNIDWQRELVLAGVESRYVVNQRDKNTADMKIVDDIRTLVEVNPAVGNAIDIIALVSVDRDFVHIVNTARFRGKRVFVLGTEGMSPELERAANEVCYLDNYLEMCQLSKEEVNPVKTREGSAMPLTKRVDDSNAVRITTRPLRVFLSHSSGDNPVVRDLYHRLRAKGIEPWLDEENLIPGQMWAKETLKAVRDSDVVIVSLSKQSIGKAGYVQKEINFALDVADEQTEKSIFIIPAKLEPCEVPERLKRWEEVNLYEERGYQRLLDSCISRVTSTDENFERFPSLRFIATSKQYER